MSQENVEIVRRIAQVWNQGGWQRVADAGLLQEDVEYHDDAGWPEARSTVGVSALVQRFEEVLESLGRDSKVEIEELVDAGEHVVAIFRFRGTAPASGLPHDYRWGYVYRVRDGQVDYMQAYLQPEQALEAAGLAE